jgi:hypothetical protein
MADRDYDHWHQSRDSRGNVESGVLSLITHNVDVIIDYLSFSESLCFGLFQLFVGKCLSQGLFKETNLLLFK